MNELKIKITQKPSDKTLQELLNEVCKKHGVSTLQDLDWAFCEAEKRNTKYLIEASNEINHQKFKRCVGMVKRFEDKIDAIKNGYIVCGIMTTCPPECNPKFSFYKKWHKRWLELAEQFKEAE